MKHRSAHLITYSQLLILIIFLTLTLCNEFFDVPHYVFGDEPTTFEQRMGEVLTEVSLFVIVAIVQAAVLYKLLRRIKILEGFLPICANCKKIRERKRWIEVENYVREHSLASFSHSLCPDCARALYPECFPNELIE